MAMTLEELKKAWRQLTEQLDALLAHADDLSHESGIEAARAAVEALPEPYSPEAPGAVGEAWYRNGYRACQADALRAIAAIKDPSES